VNVRFTPDARADVANARLWYRQRDPVLGTRFLDAVEECVAQIVAHPQIGPIVEEPIRRLLLRGFPFSVFYRLYPDEAVVIACVHGARSPQVWRRRGAG
jgi:plasmid stabilization system protein ParE